MKQDIGYDVLRTKWIFLEFDRFFVGMGATEICITRNLVELWRNTRVNDGQRTLYAKYSIWVQFCKYMCSVGYECYIPRLPKAPDKNSFTPYIFSHKQMQDIFRECDSLRLYDKHMSTILFVIPAVVRLLYGTGMRVSEALSLKNRDVDLAGHCITLRKTKNGEQRLAPLSGSLLKVPDQYIISRGKMPLPNMDDPDGYFFVSPRGVFCRAVSVYCWFRRVLMFFPRLKLQMMETTDFAKHLTNFFTKYMAGERNASPNTICSYRDTFVQLIFFMKNVKGVDAQHLELKILSKETIVDFLDWIQRERKCGNATRNYRLAAIHSFFCYLQYECPEQIYQWQWVLSIKVQKHQKKSINYLTLEGIKLIFAHIDATNAKGRRNLAMLALLYDSGARMQELIDLKPSSVRLENPYIIRILGKGRKERIVPLQGEQVDLLKSYMQENTLLEPNCNQHPLFFNCWHKKLTRSGVNYILKTYADMA